MTEGGSETGGTVLRWHAFAWLDLLGHGEALERLQKAAETDPEGKAVLRELRATYGQVRWFRDSFRRIYQAKETPIPLPKGLSPEVVARLLALRKEEAGMHGVGDAW